LSGRCPHLRVGLPPDPTGKAADCSCSTGTPSSLHFTSWLTIFASFIKPNGADPVLMPPSVVARSSPSLVFGRWSRFASESDFYRYAEVHEVHLKEAFPTLPDRSQFNRLVRFYADVIENIAVKLGQIRDR
jgi:hypothetical protein